MRLFYVKILRYTSIPLSILLYLSYLSGYGIIKPRLVRLTTFGLLDYGICIRLHTSILHYVTGLLAILHGVSGFMTILARMRRISRKRIVEIISWLLLTTLVIQLTLLEFG